MAASRAGVVAAQGGQRKLGYGAVVAGVLAVILAVVSTKSGESNLERVFVWSALIAAMLRFATPLVFAAMGGMLCERSGVINIGLEGMMLMGAFFGIFVAELAGSWFVGALAGMAAGGVLAIVHAVFSIALRADQVVSGFAVNFLAFGITGYVFVAHYGDQGTPGNVPRVPELTLPVIEDIDFVGEAIGTASLLTWVALLLVPLLALFLFRTAYGLRLRSVGEKPRAADSVGVPVLPYVLVLIVVAGLIGRSRPPASIGVPYVKE